MDKLDAILKDTPGVKYYTGVGGFSLLSAVSTTYNGFYFVSLEPWDQRNEKGLTADVIIRDLNRRPAGGPPAPGVAVAPPRRPPTGPAGRGTVIVDVPAREHPPVRAARAPQLLAAARPRHEV